jgi:hypothetical protein
MTDDRHVSQAVMAAALKASPPVKDSEDALTIAYLLGVKHGRDDERTAIADWFMRNNQRQVADSVKREDYRK